MAGYNPQAMAGYNPQGSRYPSTGYPPPNTPGTYPGAPPPPGINVSYTGHPPPGTYVPQSYPTMLSQSSMSPPQAMSTSFTTLPASGYGGSRAEVFPRDASMMQLLPAASKVEINTDYTHPMVATLLCPILGLMSLFHTHHAREELKKGNKVRARNHMEKSNSYFGYGMCLGIALWMFILALIFIIITHALINIKHYSVSQPGKFVNNQ